MKRKHTNTDQKPFVTVTFWRGTTQFTEKATTYRAALRLAAENRNAYPPRIYDQDGNELHDDGNGLHYEDEDKEKPDGTYERVYLFMA